MARTYKRDARGRFAGGGSSGKSRRSKPTAPRLRIPSVTVWHGTTPAAAAKIRKGGFRPSEDGVYGNGVYAGTRAVARQYGRSAVAIKIPKFKIRDTAGSSRQIRAFANSATLSGAAVRWPHPVADRPHQNAFTLSTADANKYRQRMVTGRRTRVRL